MTTLPRFRRKAVEVWACQIGVDGLVEVQDRQLIGSVGTWVVIDRAGNKTTWTDREFREAFEPVDARARRYLEKTIQTRKA